MKAKFGLGFKEQTHKRKKNLDRRINWKINKCNKKLFTTTVRKTLKQLKKQKTLDINDAVKIAQKKYLFKF